MLLKFLSSIFKQENANIENEVTTENDRVSFSLLYPNAPSYITSSRSLYENKDPRSVLLEIIDIIENDPQRKEYNKILSYVEFLSHYDLDLLSFYDDLDKEPISFTFIKIEYLNNVKEYTPIQGSYQDINNIVLLNRFLNDNSLASFMDEQEEKEIYKEYEVKCLVCKLVEDNGFIYRKELNRLEAFRSLRLGEYFINRMLSVRILKSDKKGRFIIYRLV
ncbi:hypothetical protein OAT16_00325 [Prolixibacteraceae bacterium]|nr:hypothetical protein [Prolixibacteraceae bacterium]